VLISWSRSIWPYYGWLEFAGLENDWIAPIRSHYAAWNIFCYRTASYCYRM